VVAYKVGDRSLVDSDVQFCLDQTGKRPVPPLTFFEAVEDAANTFISPDLDGKGVLRWNLNTVERPLLRKDASQLLASDGASYRQASCSSLTQCLLLLDDSGSLFTYHTLNLDVLTGNGVFAFTVPREAGSSFADMKKLPKLSLFLE
jgi:hypothetical protein